ncbi:MAG: hypothetical protein ACM3KE_19825 [Hyphomicrobiales bacterium]
MKRDIEPIDLKGIKTSSVDDRLSKVTVAEFAAAWSRGGRFAVFLERLPNVLAGADLKAVIAAIVNARRKARPVIFGMGAHVIKVGLSPVVIDLMERGLITGVAMNGAGIIHDAELAMTGRTSEDVGPALDDGRFGMAKETAAVISSALESAVAGETSLGRAVGHMLLTSAIPFAAKSILATGARLGLPVTVHVAIGTDIVHMHPGFDAAGTGAASHVDFRILAAQVARLEGGVYLNAGSAVILPEVFLKAVGLARNLGHRLDAFTTVDLDFIRHYRPTVNVVQRPTARGGRGISLIGHHEIMLPLIAAGVIEELEEARS